MRGALILYYTKISNTVQSSVLCFKLFVTSVHEYEGVFTATLKRKKKLNLKKKKVPTKITGLNLTRSKIS